MKIQYLKPCLLLSFFITQTAFANSGLFFNVRSVDNRLSIRTTIPNHTYTNAGIKLNTAGYRLGRPGTQCRTYKNGYCLFPASDTMAATITIEGAAGTPSFTLCLNGMGPISCQEYRAALNTR